MNEYSFVMKQKTIERNIAEFAKGAAKYGVEYSVKPLAFDEARVTVSGSCTSKIALLTGILNKEEE